MREELEAKKELKGSNLDVENVLIRSAYEAIYLFMINYYMVYTAVLITDRINKTMSYIIYLQRKIREVMFDNDIKIL